MKLILLIILLLGSASAAQKSGKLPCELTKADYESLAHAASARPIAKKDLDALSDKDRVNLCRARRFVKRVKAGEPVTAFKLDDIPTGLSRFATEAEYDVCRGVIAEVFASAAGGNR